MDIVVFIDLLPSNIDGTFARSSGFNHNGYNKLKAERKSRFTVLGSRLAAGVRDRGSVVWVVRSWLLMADRS